MTKCPHCLKDIPDGKSSCPFCGTTLGETSLPTRMMPDTSKPVKDSASKRKSPSSQSRSPISFDSIDNARFAPGDSLDGRYRIVSLLGRGGMGEVYRADDLKLGQPVALKFLPESLSADGATLARFHREVRVARQVSHRNVCRVYDIGEVSGQHFLSMEFIRGEELASLLRRIGRLPPDKAVEIARQICAGLAAAHDNNVLHRDLKPANVMIDADGNARITDFGLAGLAEEIHRDEVRAGTPAYMAPEQLAGEEVSVKSDIYSLGLVLYELFTGKRAFEAGTLDELIKLRQSNTTPTTPSSLVKEIDPLVERVILRCLEKDPKNRPASALAVAAALPGGDPLAAALAAGETPSPEMVAAAPKQGSLRAVVAVTLFASVLVMLALLMLLSKQIALYRMVPLEKSPEVLRERAGEIARNLGYTTPPTDTAYGFVTDWDYLEYIEEHDSSRTRWNKLAAGQPSAMRFWYRQSPHYLVTYSADIVTEIDPPNVVSGMVLLNVDTQGRLLRFDGVPPQAEQQPQPQQSAASPPASPDWSIIFKEAGLNQAGFQQTASQWTPPHAYDERMAWNGAYPNAPEIPIRVEAASYRGKPVYFEIVNPWQRPSLQEPFQESTRETIRLIILLAIFMGVMIIGAWLALKNMRLGRGDRKGAFRVALFIFIMRMLYWVIAKHHVASVDEFTLFLTGLQSALFWSCFVGLMYLGLEPFLRRRWPEQIISWSRLLAGDFRDPLVGRDILIGATMGVGIMLLGYLRSIVPAWLGWPSDFPHMPSNAESFGLTGMRAFLPLFINQITASVVQGFMLVFLLLFLTMLLRKKWLGMIAGWLILSAFFSLNTIVERPLVSWPFAFAFVALYVIAAARFGPLVMMSAAVFVHLLVFFPITTQLGAWYAGDFILDLIFLVALAAYGFYTSLAGQPLFRGRLLED